MSTTAAQIVRGEREMEQLVAERYRSFAALTPATAVDIVPTDPVEADRFDAMRAAGVIRGAEGGFYLDEDALERVRRRRRNWLYSGAGTIAALGVAAGFALGRRRG